MSNLLFHASRTVISTIGHRARARRMQQFATQLGVKPGMRILDLGGRPEIWESVRGPLDITILNLPGQTGAGVPSKHRTIFVEGDATQVRYPDASFDLVFSNSVIEHVGPLEKQQAFAKEVKRLAPRYWVQTPSKWFPVEAHTGMPLWWLYPPQARRAFLLRWHKDLPEWAESMACTRVLSRLLLQSLFSDAKLWTESMAGIPKSHAMYRT